MGAADYQKYLDEEAGVEPRPTTSPSKAAKRSELLPSDDFVPRHIGPRSADIDAMLALLGANSLDELVRETIPHDILLDEPLALPEAKGEHGALEELRALASKNRLFRSFIGLGYYRLPDPARHPEEHSREPGLVYAVHALSGGDRPGPPRGAPQFPDDGRGAHRTSPRQRLSSRRGDGGGRGDAHVGGNPRGQAQRLFVAEDCHPQTIAVVQTRAEPLGIDVVVGPVDSIDFEAHDLFGVLVSYPTTDGRLENYESLCGSAKERDVVVTVATDLLALTLSAPARGVRRRHRHRKLSALRRPSRSRRAPRGLHRHAGGVRPPPSRTHRGCLQGHRRQRRLPTRDPDPRAAHPSRQSDEQHLHCPGAPRDHGEHVRRLSRSRGLGAHRAAGARADGAPRGRAPQEGSRRGNQTVFRYAPRRNL